MKKVIMVEVTQQDIEKGQRGDQYSCAIARSLRGKGYTSTEVTEDEIEFDCEKTGHHFHADTPKRVSKWIERFDDSKENVKPMKFRLTADVW